MTGPSRRATVALWAGIALMAAACAPAAPTPATAPAGAPAAPAAAPAAPDAPAQQLSRLAPGTPKRSRKFILSTHDDVTSWDNYTEGSGSRLKQYSLVQDSLLRWPPSKAGGVEGVECSLCEKWEQTNPTTYLFTLKKGIKWHNGRELVADDFLWSYQHANTEKPAFRYRSIFTEVDFAQSQAVDNYTLKLVVKQPYVPFILILGDPFHAVLAKEMMASAKDEIIQEPMGTGPYIRTSYTPKVGATFKRNPDYRDKDKAFFDEIETVIIATHSERFNAFRAGQVDDHGLFMPFETAEIIRKDAKFYEVTAPRDTPPGVWVNLRNAPFDNVKVRRALDLAVDRFAMITANYGEGFLYRWLNNAVFPAYTVSQDELKKQPGYRVPKDQDIAQAKQLLAEAGYAQGFKTTMMVSRTGNNEKDAVLVREDWKKIGVDVTLDPQTQTVSTERENTGQFETALISGAIVNDTLDPDKSLDRWLPKLGRNARGTGYDNPRFTELMSAQRRETDTAKRIQIIKDIVKLMEDEVIAINTVTETYYRFWPKVCKGNIPESGYGDTVRWIATDAWCER